MLRGLRCRVGVFRGPVDRVTPHIKSGRADYFGQPVSLRFDPTGVLPYGGSYPAGGPTLDSFTPLCRGPPPGHPRPYRCNHRYPDPVRVPMVVHASAQGGACRYEQVPLQMAVYP